MLWEEANEFESKLIHTKDKIRPLSWIELNFIFGVNQFTFKLVCFLSQHRQFLLILPLLIKTAIQCNVTYSRKLQADIILCFTCNNIISIKRVWNWTDFSYTGIYWSGEPINYYLPIGCLRWCASLSETFNLIIQFLVLDSSGFSEHLYYFISRITISPPSGQVLLLLSGI